MAYNSIQTNANSLFAQNALNNTSSALNTAVKRLSTGLKINGPEDDPAGYAISQRFTTQVNGVGQAIVNGQQANTLLQTATGSIQESTNIMQKIRTIAVQAANGSNSDGDRAALQNVVAQLKDQIQTIANQTQFNGKNLLDGTFDGEQFQVGANAFQIINVSVGDTRATKMGVQQANAFTTDASVFVTGASTFAYGTDTAANSDILISGSAGQTTIDGTSFNGASGSAADIASAVNAVAKDTNVNAVARTQQTFAVSASGAMSFELSNGDLSNRTNTVTIQANITDTTDLTALVNAINQQTATTGITAQSDAGSNEISLVNAQGENIVFSGFAGDVQMTADGSTLASGANGTGIVQGVVTFQSDAGFSVSGGSASFTFMQTAAGTSFSGATAAGAGSGQAELTAVSDIDVSTTDGANLAIQIADFAIKYLNNENGRLGAQQERVTATLSNLDTAKLNLTSARGAVQDADLAEETSMLVKNQILQQAGISSLAQANQLQQSFLKLLP